MHLRQVTPLLPEGDGLDSYLQDDLNVLHRNVDAAPFCGLSRVL